MTSGCFEETIKRSSPLLCGPGDQGRDLAGNYGEWPPALALLAAGINDSIMDGLELQGGNI